MAISSFTGSFADTVTEINAKSVTNGWEISAVYDGSRYLNIRDSENHILFRVTIYAANTDIDGHGIRFYYNNGESSIGNESHYGSSARTCSTYFTSHGFIIINNASREVQYGFLNVNDDGSIIYGGATANQTPTLYGNLTCYKYDEANYQALNFTPHANTSGTTLCNMIAAGSLGEPSIAQYAFYSPVYQTTDRGIVEIDDEQYVTIGYWYMKD